MPNKDSFTFSDKLKKSKSLPLSKRIPSRVGGDGKAKRTLIQRAQRDLPFIIVAAAALLLLPLLSRNSDSDTTGLDSIGGYEDWVTEGADYNGYGIGGDGDIVPDQGYRNPLDNIIVNKAGQDTEGYDGVDPSDVAEAINQNSQEETSSSQSEINTYRPKVKKSIRNAVQRKATEVKGLRNRGMNFGSSGSGLSRNLAIGGAPTRGASASTPRAGVRPVALQPLKAGGAGRVLTGEGFYAEADRSARAMNQGPAKQALFEAQLRDVDGSPLGAAGDPRKSAARIGGGPANPNSKFNYTNQKPWWWDMMNERSQKLWELWNYNWQKALSDSLIKVATNLAMCLMTGSEDGSVKYFLGKKGGDKDLCCVVKGMELCAGDIGDYTSSSSGSGDSKETTNNSFDAIQKFCDSHNAETYPSESGRKNALQTRFECLGLKAGKMAWLSGTDYKAICDGVNKNPIVYEATATRKADGKVREKKQNKVVVYLKAKSKNPKVNDGKEFIIALEKTNKYTFGEDQLDEIGANCTVTRIGSYAAKGTKKRISKKAAGYNASDIPEEKPGKTTKEPTLNDREIERLQGQIQKDEEGNPIASEENTRLYAQISALQSGRATVEGYEPKDVEEDEVGEVFVSDYLKGKVNAAYGYCAGKNSIPAEFVDEDDVQKDIRVKTQIGAVCEIWQSDTVMGTPKINGSMECSSPEANEIDVLAESSFSVTLSKPKAANNKLFAIFVEHVQSAQTGSKGDYTTVVKHWVADKDMSSATNQDGSVTYTVPAYRPGKATDSKETATSKSVPGNGKVFWVLTNKASPNVKVGDTIGDTLSSVSTDDLIGPTAGRKDTVCYYKWGCNGDECKKKEKEEEDPKIDGENFCMVKDGYYRLYEAIRIPSGQTNIYIQKSTEEVDGERRINFLKERVSNPDDPNCPSCIEEAIQEKKIHLCTPICKKVLENMQATGRNVHERDTDGKSKGEPLFDTSVSDTDIEGLNTLLAGPEANALCPFCNTDNTETEHACNFDSFVEFETSKFSGGIGYDAMYDAFLNCLNSIANNKEKTNQQLFSTGFTSAKGSIHEKCPAVYPHGTEKQDPANPYAIKAADGSNEMRNYLAYEPQSTVSERRKDVAKNCNRALSEDRAIFSLHQMIGQLKNSPEGKDLENKIQITVKADHAATYVGFSTTGQKESGKVDKYFRYNAKHSSPHNSFGSGPVKIVIQTEGCGPDGLSDSDIKSETDNQKDRVMYFTTSSYECKNRAAFAAAVAK